METGLRLVKLNSKRHNRGDCPRLKGQHLRLSLGRCVLLVLRVHSLLQRRSTNILLSPRRHANDPCAECRIPLKSRSAPFAIVCVFLTLHDAAKLAKANHPHETLTRRASSGALTSRFSSLFRQGLGNTLLTFGGSQSGFVWKRREAYASSC